MKTESDILINGINITSLNYLELTKVIDKLQNLKETKKQNIIDNAKTEIKEELPKAIENTMFHFESEFITELRGNYENLDILWEYNYSTILNIIKNNLDVDVWECK